MQYGFQGNNSCVSQMLRLRKKRRDKFGITYFGLLGHEVASLRSMIESAPDLAAGYELREPNQADTCGIVLVNKDNQLATSWWKNYKKRHPMAVPLFLTDSKQDPEDNAYCKRPFSPSVLQGAFQDLVSESTT
ncbi:MAG: hypothetical protein OER91_14095 [Gammaproteobacteria bacterium]|nr:hypothetical protein [Gammaproteobacteria bacterium]